MLRIQTGWQSAGRSDRLTAHRKLRRVAFGLALVTCLVGCQTAGSPDVSKVSRSFPAAPLTSSHFKDPTMAASRPDKSLGGHSSRNTAKSTDRPDPAIRQVAATRAPDTKPRPERTSNQPVAQHGADYSPTDGPQSPPPVQSVDAVRQPGPSGKIRQVNSQQFVTDVLPQSRPTIQQPVDIVNQSLGLHPNADQLHGQYEQRAMQSVDSEMDTTTDALMAQMPTGYEPWWNRLVLSERRAGSQFVPVNLDSLIFSALQNSPHIQAVETTAPIARTNVFEAEAEFDWHAFIDTHWDDISDPVGNALLTGGESSRFRDHVLNSTTGVRKKLTSGAEFEVGQRFGYRDNNSRFLIPNQQGTSQLTLSFTQPLLNGAGETYNLSRIVLAELDAESAESEVSKNLQAHLLEVAAAYWELYRARALTAQKRRLLSQAIVIRDRLAGRQQYDALRSQLARAQSAVAARNAELIRSELGVRNGETRLRVLVNDPMLMGSDQLEFVPHDQPINQYFPISKRQSLLTALRNRPEIVTGIKAVQAATVQIGVAKKDILPTLDLVLETYVYGLEGHSDIPQSYVNQFKIGDPSYSIGLQFEVPLGQRAARAREERRQLELQQNLFSLRATLETVSGDVESSVRDTETAYREMQSRYVAMQAAEAEVNYLYQRWISLPGRNGSTSWLLQDLLDSQERRAAEEGAFVGAQVNYMLSLTRLKKAIGTLITVDEAPVMATQIPMEAGSAAQVIEQVPTIDQVPTEPVPTPSFGHSFTLPEPPPLPPSQKAQP